MVFFLANSFLPRQCACGIKTKLEAQAARKGTSRFGEDTGRKAFLFIEAVGAKLRRLLFFCREYPVEVP